MASGDHKKKRPQCRSIQNPCLLLRKVVELMEHPISEYAVQRHLPMLNEFLNASQYAFWLQDIPYIIRLYENIAKKLEAIPELQRPLECLLYFSAVPPMLIKPSDKIEYARDLQEYFSILGYLILCLHDDELKKLVLNALKGLLQPKPPIGPCCIPLENCREAAAKSRLPEILAQLLQVVSSNVYPSLLDVMFVTCQTSISTCHKMLAEDAVEYLLQRIEPTWDDKDRDAKPRNPTPKDNIPVFEDTCCILWKLLNAVDREKVDVKNPTLPALWNLQYAFRWSNLTSGQKANRNNLTAIILKIMITFPTMDFLASDLSDDVLILAGSAAGCGCRSHLEFSEDQLDFQFKKLIWACLHFYYRFQKEEEVYKENEIVKTFLKTLFQEHQTNKNHVEQYCDLTKIALRIIPRYVTGSIDVFLQVDGPRRIIGLIEGFLLKTYDVETLEAYVYCLSEILLLKVEDILFAFDENKTVNIITSVCSKLLETSTVSVPHQKVLGRSFCMLQIFCDAGHTINVDVVDMCIDYLHRVIHPTETDPIIDKRVNICAIHLLWQCIFTKRRLYRQFLKKGGIYIILDITEGCTFPVKSIALGILSDIAKRPSCVPYLITWRKRGKKLIPMLLEIFRNKTEKHCDGKHNIELSDEVPTNMWLALCHQRKLWMHTLCVTKPELLKNCRGRIHGIIYAVKVRFKKRVKIADEHYRLFNEKLNTDDELTMLFAEHFLSLKMCESWLNVAKELQKDGITPVDQDNQQLMEKVGGIKQWRSYVRNIIKTIVHKDIQHVKYKELATYASLKEARLSDALDALKELRYVARCTERMFQLRKKLILTQEVEAITITNTNFHRTICELPFSTIYNQTISIQSNIIYDKEEQVLITPVSSDDEDSFGACPTDHDLIEEQLEC